MASASSRSWVTTTAVAPSARRAATTSARTWGRSAASRAENGSSRRISDGWGASARASATRCCCPPESWWGWRPSNPSSPVRARHSAIRPERAGAPGEPEADVLRHGEVGEQGALLGDDAHPAVLGGDERAVAGHQRAADGDRAGIGALEAGDQAEDGGLAAARRAEDRGDRALLHLDVDVDEDGGATEGLAHTGDAEGGHPRGSSSRPRVSRAAGTAATRISSSAYGAPEE